MWRDSRQWPVQVKNCQPGTDPTCSTPISVVEARTIFKRNSNNNGFRVELRVVAGAAGLNLPGSGDVRLAFNALRTHIAYDPVQMVTEYLATQLNWPTVAVIPGVPIGGAGGNPGPGPDPADVKANPEFSTWGTASLTSQGQQCPGVRVKRTWINAESNPSTMARPPAMGTGDNNFHIEIENTGQGGAGNVLATLLAYRFGSVPYSNFGKVGSTVGNVSPSNPVSSYDGTTNPIASQTTRETSPIKWTLTRAEYDTLRGSDHNVCSVVELDVDTAHVPTGVQRTLIANRQSPWNIGMGQSSVFSHTALLASAGYARDERSPTNQTFDILVSTDEIESANAGNDRVRTKSVLPPKQASELSLRLLASGGLSFFHNGEAFYRKSVCPLRRTGRSIRLDGRDVELLERSPCFEYWVHHKGILDRWLDKMAVTTVPGTACLTRTSQSGQPCLIQTGFNRYSITLPFDGSVELETTIEAQESARSRYALWLALGPTFPQGSFSNQHKSGLAATLGFEYLFTPTYSVEATLARHSFGGRNGGGDIDVTQFGVNGKWYFAQPGFKPFVTLGVGSYAFDPGSTRFGVNLGAGVQVELSPHWSLEGRYSLNKVSSNAPNSNYSTLQLGLRYAF
jgi:opacity protein-like surface antigen